LAAVFLPLQRPVYDWSWLPDRSQAPILFFSWVFSFLLTERLNEKKMSFDENEWQKVKRAIGSEVR
jgi:hypothetical protein